MHLGVTAKRNKTDLLMEACVVGLSQRLFQKLEAFCFCCPTSLSCKGMRMLYTAKEGNALWVTAPVPNYLGLGTQEEDKMSEAMIFC